MDEGERERGRNGRRKEVMDEGRKGGRAGWTKEGRKEVLTIELPQTYRMGLKAVLCFPKNRLALSCVPLWPTPNEVIGAVAIALRI